MIICFLQNFLATLLNAQAQLLKLPHLSALLILLMLLSAGTELAPEYLQILLLLTLPCFKNAANGPNKSAFEVLPLINHYSRLIMCMLALTAILKMSAYEFFCYHYHKDKFNIGNPVQFFVCMVSC